MAKRKTPAGAKKKSAKKVRVEFRRNRNQPARDRSWTRQFREHAFELADPKSSESVAPKGELSRKRTVLLTPEPDHLPLGRVIAMRGLIAEVRIPPDVLVPCTVRRILRTRLIRERHPVTVGDRVRISPTHANPSHSDNRNRPAVLTEGVIEWVAPRTGCLSRKSANRIHTIAANVDQALIVTSAAQPYCKPHLIDRYLVLAHAGDITPVIVFNKIDLDRDHSIDQIRARYDHLGYQTLPTSATTGTGLPQLRDLMRDRCSAIIGQSGVGKSSLLNGVQPGLKLATASVSADTEKGTHTTSTAVLLPLDFGGFVVDTPGIKSLELAYVGKHELEMYFVDLEPFVADCKFPDCTHTHESDCAVKAALDQGKIHPERYESYLRLFQED